MVELKASALCTQDCYYAIRVHHIKTQPGQVRYEHYIAKHITYSQSHISTFTQLVANSVDPRSWHSYCIVGR